MLKSETATNDEFKFFLARIWRWTQNHFYGLFFTFCALSLAFFAIWLCITLFWPSQDAQRMRTTVQLTNGGNLIIDYPKRFLADELSRPIYLTIDTNKPTAITLEFTSSLPLLITAVEPSSAVKIIDASSGHLIVTWPITARSSVFTGATPPTVTPTATTLANKPTPAAVGASQSPPPTSSTTIRSVIPLIAQPNTVSLFLGNSHSERGWPPFSGFTNATFTVVGAGEQTKIEIDVETTDRANLRSFVREYSFIAVLPFLIPSLGFLYKTYTERQKQQRKEAQVSLEKFKEIISTAPAFRRVIEDQFASVKQSSKYVISEDMERVERMFELSKGTISREKLTSVDFTIWPDAWVGALCMANAAIGTPQEESEAQRIDHSGQAGMHTQIDRKALYGWVRIFPRDLLSIPAERQFRDLTQQLHLNPVQQHAWPLPADPPKEYSRHPTAQEQNQAQPLTIRRMGLFPGTTASSSIERSYLFSDATKWFWREHPVYNEIVTNSMPILVYGEQGVGRTALGLALTRYADRNREKVLGSYHTGSIALTDIQHSLARDLVRFICLRSTWLTNLERESRDLLAIVLSSVLDIRYLLSQLSAPESGQFGEATDDEGRAIWEQHAQVEFRLLRQSLERMEGKSPIPTTRWFEVLSYCIAQLGFQRARVALDMTAEEWGQWRVEQLSQFLYALSGDLPRPIQLVLLIPGDEKAPDVQISNIIACEMKWVGNQSDAKDHLLSMLKHRAHQRGIIELLQIKYLQAIEVLSRTARGNPRRLAELWMMIAARHPDANAVTEEMVAEVERETE